MIQIDSRRLSGRLYSARPFDVNNVQDSSDG